MFPDEGIFLSSNLVYLHVSSYYIFDSWKYSSEYCQFSFDPLTNGARVRMARWRSIVIRIMNRRVTECVFRRLFPLFTSRNRPCFGRKFMGRKQGRPPEPRPVQNFNGTSDSSASLALPRPFAGVVGRIGLSWTVTGVRGISKCANNL